MARTSEHTIKRTLFEYQKLARNGIGARAFCNIQTQRDTFNNPYIQNCEEQKCFYNTLSTINASLDNLTNHLNLTYNKEIFSLNTSDYYTLNGLSKKIDKLQTNIENYLSLSTVYKHPARLTTKDFFEFASFCLNIKLTDENYLSKRFGNDIINLSNCSSFKDILYIRYSDKTLAFLIAIIIVCEKSSSTLPFSFFKKDFMSHIFNNVCTSHSEPEQLKIIFKNIKSLHLTAIPISEEARYPFIFYTSISHTMQLVSRKYNAYNSVLKSFGFIYMKKYQPLISSYCIYSTDIFNLIPPDVTDNTSLQNYRKDIVSSFNLLKASYQALLHKYFSLVPKIIQEISFQNEYEKLLDNKDELIKAVNEIDFLLEGNNKAKFLSVFNCFNSPAFDENILLVIFNLLLLKDNIAELLMNVCLLKYTDCSDKCNLKVSDCTLEELLNRRQINYHYVELLTQIDYNSFSDLKFRFTLSLLELYKKYNPTIIAFLNLLKSLNGNDAFNCIDDIDNFLT